MYGALVEQVVQFLELVKHVSKRSKGNDEKAVLAYFDCPNRRRRVRHGR